MYSLEGIKISALSLQGMYISATIAILLPFLIMITLRIKTKCKVSPFFLGICSYLLFAMFLEALFTGLVNRFTGGAMRENIVMFAIFGGLAAVCFEEFGRYFVMKFLMKDHLTKQNSLMYGVGHGAAESIILVGIVYISNIFVSHLINEGALQDTLLQMDEAMRAETYEGIRSLWESPTGYFYLAGVDAIGQMFLQICISYLVYKAATSNDFRMMVLAMLIHFAKATIYTLLCQVVDVMIVEAFFMICVVALIVFTFKLYEKEEVEEL